MSVKARTDMGIVANLQKLFTISSSSWAKPEDLICAFLLRSLPIRLTQA
jgi:hypothetical protein